MSLANSEIARADSAQERISPENPASLTISVLVPTYRRPEDLRRCLASLNRQTRPAEEVVIVARPEDTQSIEIVNEWTRYLPLRLQMVGQAGVVNALNAGLQLVKGGIVAITDDDAAPRPDWLARIETHFLRDSRLGGVGGRDLVHNAENERGQKCVGRIQWFGRIIGNHHLGIGEPRPVHLLKGVNMSFRTSVITKIGFDINLRGTGAQVRNEMALSLAVQKVGWRLVYDPAVIVDHYPSIRHDSDYRLAPFNPVVTTDAAFNQFWVIGTCMTHGPRRVLAILWCVLIGTRDQPGVFAALLGFCRAERLLVRRWHCARAGRGAARREMNSASKRLSNSSETPFPRTDSDA